MGGIEKFMAATLLTVMGALVLTNPAGTQAAGAAAGNLYQSIVSSFFKPK